MANGPNIFQMLLVTLVKSSKFMPLEACILWSKCTKSRLADIGSLRSSSSESSPDPSVDFGSENSPYIGTEVKERGLSLIHI